jgi:hypothetical protein
MRDSIEWNSSGNEGHVGSNNDKAVWHELGTVKIPPSPGDLALKALTARRPPASALHARQAFADPDSNVGGGPEGRGPDHRRPSARPR